MLRAVPDDELGPTERVLYLTAAMTGHAPRRAASRCAGATSTGPRGVDPRPPQLRRRRVRPAEEPPLEPRRPDGRPRRRRARAPLTARSRYRDDDDLVFCHPAARHRLRPLEAAQALRRAPARARASGRSASTTSATRSAPRWPPPARRCGRSRSGWATATTAPPASTPTTRPTRARAPTTPPRRSAALGARRSADARAAR